MAKHHKEGKPGHKRGRGGRHPGPPGGPSLVSLAIARTGREIDASMLQITDQAAFARMSQQQMSAMMGWVRKGRSLEDVEQATSTHETPCVNPQLF